MQEKLLIIRKKNKVSQEKLAEILNISVKTYAFKETGKTEFTMSEMFKIADYFNMEINEIFIPTILQNGV